jgi:hypothetical protein
LQVDGALHGIDGTGEFNQYAIARDLEDAPLAFRN